MASTRSRTLFVLLASVLMLSTACALAPTSAAPSQAPVKNTPSMPSNSGDSCISNGFLSAQVDDVNGLFSFSIGTCAEASSVEDRILYFAGTSFVTVADFTYGVEYTEAGQGGGVPLGSPVSSSVVGSSIVTVFPETTTGLVVVQNITLFGTTNSDSAILMSVEVNNDNPIPQSVGIRYLWDYQVGGYDGSWLWEYDGMTPGVITGYETDFNPPTANFTSYVMGGCSQGNVTPPPYLCKSTNFGVGAGSFGIAGSVSVGRGATAPARLIYGWWAAMQKTAYTYVPNPQDEVGSYSPNVGGTQDSAVLYYFTNETLTGNGGSVADQADVSTTPGGIPNFSAGISLSPFWGADGTTVAVSGKNLEPFSPLTLTSFGDLGPIQLNGNCITDQTGNLSSSQGCTFNVPQSAPEGAYLVTFSDGTNSPAATFVVTGAGVGATSLSVSCGPASVVVGTVTKCQVVAKGPVTPQPTGVIVWSSDNLGVFSSSSCSLRAKNGSTACSVSFTPTAAGSPVLLTASYAGDSKNSPAIGAFALTVTDRASSVQVQCASLTTYVGGSSTTCKVIVTGYIPSGIVEWSSSGSGGVAFADRSCALSKGTFYYIVYSPILTVYKKVGGICSVTFTGARAGKVSVNASYLGDSANFPSSAVVRVTVLKVKPRMSVSCPQTTLAVGEQETCTVSFTGGFGPTGTVAWSKLSGTGDVTFSQSSCALSSGTCSVSVTASASGSVRIRAAYSGDVNNFASTAATTVVVS